MQESDTGPAPRRAADLEVVLLGDPRLRRVCLPVEDLHEGCFLEQKASLSRALDAFRAAHGFGRAIAAPQIGIARRFIALALPDFPAVIVNPSIARRSDDTFTLWDDCMSFPDLLVRVRRHCSISVRFLDQRGDEQVREDLDRATSELLQHEIDHLDGVLAVDRALDHDSLVLREVFERDRERLGAVVDGV